MNLDFWVSLADTHMAMTKFFSGSVASIMKELLKLELMLLEKPIVTIDVRYINSMNTFNMSFALMILKFMITRQLYARHH